MLFAFNGRATRNFLGLLVLMHFILFVDRVNLAAAAGVMQKDLGLSNIALGLAFSAFNYAYAPFQLVGGWFAYTSNTSLLGNLIGGNTDSNFTFLSVRGVYPAATMTVTFKASGDK